MRDLVYHTQLGRLALDASEERRLQSEARALALYKTPRAIYRLGELVESEDDATALRAIEALTKVSLPRLEAVTVSAPDGGPIQVEHDHSSLVAKMFALRDELMGRKATVDVTVDALPLLPDTAAP